MRNSWLLYRGYKGLKKHWKNRVYCRNPSRIDVILAAVAVVETELQPFTDCKYSEYVLVEAQFKRK